MRLNVAFKAYVRSPLGETDVMGQHPPHPHPTLHELQTTQALYSILQGLSHFISSPLGITGWLYLGQNTPQFHRSPTQQ